MMRERLLRVEWAYVLFAVPLATFLALAMPPFQNPDEIAHFLRADQIAGGEWVGYRAERAPPSETPRFRLSDDLSFGLVPDRAVSGGRSDPNILALAETVRDIPFHPDRRVDRNTLQEAARIGWSGERTYFAFSNTAIYAPPLYLLPAAAISAGRALDLSIWTSLRLTRVVNALAVIALGALAIRWCRHGKLTMAALLALPMSLSMAAAVSQDGAAIACAALAAAILSRLREDPWTVSGGQWAILIGTLSLIALARPPYLACGGVLLAIAVGHDGLKAGRGRLALTVLIPGLIVVGWILIAREGFVPIVRPGHVPDPGQQLQTILSDPVHFVRVLVATGRIFGGSLWASFVGVLGWLDTGLPRLLHGTASVMLACLVWADATRGRDRVRLGWAAAAFGWLSLASAAFGVTLSMYLSYNHPGSDLIEGLQGRYFIPLALFATLLIPPLAAGGSRWRLLPPLCAATFAVTAAIAIPLRVLARYYGL